MPPTLRGFGQMIVDCILRYRQQLAQSMTRKQNLEQAKEKVELDWQRHCDDLETEWHRWTDNLVQDLTSTRQEVCATAYPH